MLHENQPHLNHQNCPFKEPSCSTSFKIKLFPREDQLLVRTTGSCEKKILPGFEDKSSHLLVTAPLLPGLWGSSQCWWHWAHVSVSYFGISPERNILTVIFCSLFFQERKHARRYQKEHSQPTMLLPDWLTYLDKCRLRSGLSAIRCV